MDARSSSKAAIAAVSIDPLVNCSQEAAREKFCRQFPELFELYPVQEYIRLLDSTQRGKSMFHVSPPVHDFRERVISEWGQDALEIYHRVTMLALMDAFSERARQHNYPASVLRQFRLSIARIEKAILRKPIGWYPHDGDNFIKDFSLCRQTAFPGGGAWVIDHCGGFPRHVMFNGGVGQFFRLAWLYLFVTRGHRPLYAPHIHNELVHLHTQRERQACHLRIVEMLERHPRVKGMAGSSWLTDPALRSISPQLRWVREIPEANGSKYFRVGEDIDGGALTRSATRRRLYQEGKYTPTKYLNIWARKSMIAWAGRVRQDECKPVRARGEYVRQQQW
jgi:hypothetical protein